MMRRRLLKHKNKKTWSHTKSNAGSPPPCLDNTRARRAAGRCVLWGTPESAARPWDATLLLDGQTLDRQRGALHVTMADGRIACCCCLALGGGAVRKQSTRGHPALL